ncbi:MAG: 4-hydroxythreonine-4-phosphate dehydrogenase PdxA [Bacteroidota bacterium]
MKPVIAVTVGDYNGIGPEVVLKSILRPAVRRRCSPVLVGPAAAFEHAARMMRIPLGRLSVPIIEPRLTGRCVVRPGHLSAHAGAAAAAAIREAVRMTMEGTASALVTAPVSKQALHRAGVQFPGQTEFLQHLTRARGVAMLLASHTLRVGLATIHLPLRAVPSNLTQSLLVRRLKILDDALHIDWRISKPRIAVLGLNPHAGEEGELGMEERRLILPAIVRLRRAGLRLDGPFPADAFFARKRQDAYDAVFAMYHDQGLIPLKMSARGRAVNVSLGLPIVRTSPDHGTAFDIAGKGVAEPASMIEAIFLALAIARNRAISARRGLS